MNSVNQLEIIRLFAQFAAQFLESEGTLIEAATEACSDTRREEARNFFMKHGVDGEVVTQETLDQAAYACGWHKRSLKPHRSFQSMLEAIKQHGEGLVTDGELIMALQMVPHQVLACRLYNNLPLSVHRKVSLSEWDDDIESCAEKGTPPNMP